MTNSRRTLYIGVTNNLLARVDQHKNKSVDGYTSRYNLTKLVHYEEFQTAREAISREKYLKGLLRGKKIAIIEENNPFWQDLSRDWYERNPSLHSI